MADISKIKLPDNTEYEIKDAKARMVILSYGNSTWQDFLTAYQNKCVVYCRASSNSNPATGSQTRLAFMAYVSNADTPTNVEFQYYRSMSKHTDAQQGDQVFVYKLTNANKWTVTTRNAFSKVIAGTNLTSSFVESETNSSITLSADYDSTVTQDSTKLITSGAVYTAISALPPQTETITDTPIASFSDGADNVPVSELIVDIDAVQAGSGTPSPDNVRAISGWSECNIHKSGINLWDEEWELGTYDANGETVSSNDRIRSKNYIPCLGNTEYYYKGERYGYFYFYDNNKTYISNVAKAGNSILTTPTNAKFIRFRLEPTYGTTYNNDISINYPATDTEYHAYNGTTYNIPLGQTVYGGSLNVKTGVLTITHGIVTYSSNDGFIEHSSGRFYKNELPDDCDYLNGASSISNVATYADNRENGAYYVFGSSGIYVNKLTPSETLSDLNTRLSTTPMDIVYPLATPTTVQLTPKEVRSLLNCNIFADTGDVDELIYFKASSNDVAKLIEAYSSAENVIFNNDGTDLSSTDVQNGMVELSSKRFAYKNVESSTNVDDLKAQGVYYGYITNMPLLAQGGIVITTTKPVFTAVQVYPNVVMGTLYVGSQIAIGNSGAMFVRGSTYTPPITTTPPDASDRPASVTWKDWHQVAFWEDIFGESINYTPESGTTIYEEIESIRSPSTQTVTLAANSWDSSTHLITVSVTGVTSTSVQDVIGLPATSPANISNNEALQDANIMDAGQSTGSLTFYAETVPTTDLQIRVIVRG